MNKGNRQILPYVIVARTKRGAVEFHHFKTEQKRDSCYRKLLKTNKYSHLQRKVMQEFF